ncbi:MAG TPA: DUF1570 domain-containing protein [Planctomycetota bacterium]
MAATSLLLTLLLAAPGGEPSDRVLLKNGKELLGRVLFQDATTLVLRQDGRDTELELGAIARVESRRANLATLLENAARADLGDVEELELLAAQAEEMGLPGEAQVFWWRLLRLDPERQDARRSLGHEKRGGGWTLPLGRRQVDEARRVALARDWGTAWELASFHYRLRTNLPLERALELLLDLERVYAAFQALIGAELRLFDVTRPLSVHVHATRASYPETANEGGMYDSGADIVHVNAAERLDCGVLAHELVHQLLYVTVFRERGASAGTLPGWMDEGLAEYVGSTVSCWPAPHEPGRVRKDYFRLQADAPRPLDLTRVLSLAADDYYASTDRDLKYAQSYTLVHFLLHGDGGRHRAGFLAFLRQVYAGKGSSTDLKRALDTDWRTLEKAWLAYVRQQAS